MAYSKFGNKQKQIFRRQSPMLLKLNNSVNLILKRFSTSSGLKEELVKARVPRFALNNVVRIFDKRFVKMNSQIKLLQQANLEQKRTIDLLQQNVQLLQQRNMTQERTNLEQKRTNELLQQQNMTQDKTIQSQDKTIQSLRSSNEKLTKEFSNLKTQFDNDKMLTFMNQESANFRKMLEASSNFYCGDFKKWRNCPELQNMQEATI